MSNNFSNPVISASVGKGGRNKPSDIFIIQRLLNECSVEFEGRGSLVPDGRIGIKTYNAIKNFQKTVVGSKRPDIRIDVNGKSFKTLISKRDPVSITLNTNIASKNEKLSINSKKFISLYKEEFKDHKLTGKSENGLEFLISNIFSDINIIDIRWVAYMLATVKHECANMYLPIEESGKGSYFSKKENKQITHKYSKTVKVLDPATNKERDNIYYGRGYVQLTWEENYKFLGHKIGLGDKLYINPELALEPEIAYKIMSYGMRHGSFTNVGLNQFITGSYCDYKGS